MERLTRAGAGIGRRRSLAVKLGAGLAGRRTSACSCHRQLVSFMQYDLGYFDHETCRLEPIENPFAANVCFHR